MKHFHIAKRLRHTLRHKKSLSIISSALAALVLVVGAFMVSTLLHPYHAPLSLVPESIGLGQGVAACGSSVGVTCDSSTGNDSISWTYSISGDVTTDGNINAELLANGSAIQTWSHLPASGTLTSSEFAPNTSATYQFEVYDDGYNMDASSVYDGVACSAPPPAASTGVVEGYKVNKSGTYFDPGATISVAGQNSSGSNPYYFYNVPSGWQTITSSAPSGYTVWYIVGTDGGGANVWYQGTSASVNVPSGSYADVWWMYATPPSDPPSVSAICNSSTSATISWPAVSGATQYQISTNGGPSCPTGWTLWTDGTTCYIDPATNASLTIPVTPGRSYTAYAAAADTYGGWNWNNQANTSFTCTAAPTGPDLGAGSVTPTTVSVGTPSTFSATITNSGGASTGTSFHNLFQVATGLDGSGNGTGVQDIAASSLPPLAGRSVGNAASVLMSVLGAGSSAPTSDTYTFASAGNDYMRVCADMVSAGTMDSVVVTDPNNLCGNWTGITVTNTGSSCSAGSDCSGGLCSSGTCVASCPSGTGDSSGLCCPTGYTNQGGVCAASCTPACGGGQSCTAPDVCSCPSGQTLVGGTCTAPPSITNFSVNPTRVRSGGSTQLIWSSTGADSCTLTGQNGFLDSADLNSPAGGDASDTDGGSLLTSQTSFTLTCENGAGSTSLSETVFLLPSVQEK